MFFLCSRDPKFWRFSFVAILAAVMAAGEIENFFFIPSFFFPQEIFDCFLKGADFGLFLSSSWSDWRAVGDRIQSVICMCSALLSRICTVSFCAADNSFLMQHSHLCEIPVFFFFFFPFSFAAAASKPQVILQAPVLSFIRLWLMQCCLPMGWDLGGAVFHPGGLQASSWYKHFYTTGGNVGASGLCFWHYEDALQIQQCSKTFLRFCVSFTAAKSPLVLVVA